MRVLASDRFPLPLPEGHRFPAEKYRMLRERVESSGWLRPGELLEAPRADDRTLALAHDVAYVGRVARGELDAKEQRELGFPWSPELVERSRRSVGATVEAALGALEDGVGVSLAGGTHHAFADRGEGFCVFNDIAVAARLLLRDRLVERVAVIDLDVHQGNGTAAIFAGDPRVFTLSLHGARNYPLRKRAGDCDVELPDKTTDDAYLAALHDALRRVPPVDFAFYLAGADPFADDRLGRLALSKAGLAERDRVVLARAEPVAVVMGGGYAKDVADAVDIHAETVRQAVARARARQGSTANPPGVSEQGDSARTL